MKPTTQRVEVDSVSTSTHLLEQYLKGVEACVCRLCVQNAKELRRELRRRDRIVSEAAR